MSSPPPSLPMPMTISCWAMPFDVAGLAVERGEGRVVQTPPPPLSEVSASMVMFSHTSARSARPVRSRASVCSTVRRRSVRSAAASAVASPSGRATSISCRDGARAARRACDQQPCPVFRVAPRAPASRSGCRRGRRRGRGERSSRFLRHTASRHSVARSTAEAGGASATMGRVTPLCLSLAPPFAPSARSARHFAASPASPASSLSRGSRCSRLRCSPCASSCFRASRRIATR